MNILKYDLVFDIIVLIIILIQFKKLFRKKESFTTSNNNLFSLLSQDDIDNINSLANVSVEKTLDDLNYIWNFDKNLNEKFNDLEDILLAGFNVEAAGWNDDDNTGIPDLCYQ